MFLHVSYFVIRNYKLCREANILLDVLVNVYLFGLYSLGNFHEATWKMDGCRFGAFCIVPRLETLMASTSYMARFWRSLDVVRRRRRGGRARHKDDGMESRLLFPFLAITEYTSFRTRNHQGSRDTKEKTGRRERVGSHLFVSSGTPIFVPFPYCFILQYPPFFFVSGPRAIQLQERVLVSHTFCLSRTKWCFSILFERQNFQERCISTKR